MSESKNKPVEVFRIGLVKVSEWENIVESNKDRFVNVNYTIDASYYDKKTKDFKPTNSLNEKQLNDLKIIISNIQNGKVTKK